jgi:hypothetical protein
MRLICHLMQVICQFCSVSSQHNAALFISHCILEYCVGAKWRYYSIIPSSLPCKVQADLNLKSLLDNQQTLFTFHLHNRNQHFLKRHTTMLKRIPEVIGKMIKIIWIAQVYIVFGKNKGRVEIRLR